MAGKSGLKSKTANAAKMHCDYLQNPAGIRFAGIDGRHQKTRHLAVASKRLALCLCAYSFPPCGSSGVFIRLPAA
jgi:hypothetical protein